MIRKRCKNDVEVRIVELIEKLHQDSIIEVGSSSLNAEMALPQSSVLSSVLFNVYLENALDSSQKLKEINEEERGSPRIR